MGKYIKEWDTITEANIINFINNNDPYLYVDKYSMEAAPAIYIEAITVFKNMIEKDYSIDNLNSLAGLTYNLGVVYGSYYGMEEDAITTFLEALEIQKELVKKDDSDEHNLAIILNSIGVCYLYSKKYDKAKEYFMESDIICKRLYPPVDFYKALDQLQERQERGR